MSYSQELIRSVIGFGRALGRVASNVAKGHFSWQRSAQNQVLRPNASRAAAIAVAIIVFFCVGYINSERAEAAPSLPAGFSLAYTSTPLGGVSSYNLTDIKYVPQSTGVEAGLFAAGKDGKVAWIPDIGTGRLLGTVPNVLNNGDAGLLAVTAANDYATSGIVYVLYVRKVTSTTGFGVVEAWKVNSPAGPTSIAFDRTVIDGSPGLTENSGAHLVGDLLAWPDGSIFISQGDETGFSSVDKAALRAQDINDPHGKVFHITPDGKGATDNPYYDAANPSSWKSRVYAYGFRNAYRLWRDESTNKIGASSVGWNTIEEFDVVNRGGNYGWPCWEGSAQTTGYKDLTECQTIYAQTNRVPPIWTYSHAGQGASITGGAVYSGTRYPAQYAGKTFIGDYARQQMWTLGTNGQTLTSAAVSFGTGLGALTAVRSCQGGDICWTDITNSQIVRLKYSSANNAPVAQATSTVNPATRTVSFDASGSYDVDKDTLSYSWNFGDGQQGTGVKATHTYAGHGPYTVTLTVTDTAGATGTASLTVVPDNNTPTVTLQTPPASSTFAVGDTVNVSATVTDVEDGALAASAVQWSVLLLHCPFNGTCHTHPSTTSTGASFSTVFPDHGGDTKLVISATSPPDAAGVRTTQSYTAMPRLRTITVAAPAGVQPTINGALTAQAPAVVNANASISVPASVDDLTFAGWADAPSAGASRQFTVPDNDVTYTPIYNSLIDQRYQQLGGTSSFLGTPIGPERIAGDGKVRDYTGGALTWRSSTGVVALHQQIADVWRSLGGADGVGGLPTHDDVALSGGGWWNNFPGMNVYYTPSTGAHEVYGLIRDRYLALGGHTGWVGLPTSGEVDAGGGRMNSFVGANLYWSAATGVHEIHGPIRDAYVTRNGVGLIGLPTTDETATPDGIGRYNHFQLNGSIYWTSSTGAHIVMGDIRAKWASLGWERSRLKYPTSDEFAITGGRRNNFQGGYITWKASTRQTTVVYT
jgi:glucose/arabinose dehydrogenase/PKD repeat protein